jgi:hypothetical protein
MNLACGSEVALVGFWEYMFGILVTVQVSFLLIGQRGLGDSFRYLVCANFTPTPEENNLTVVQYKQQTNPRQSIHNYTPLVISMNDKNK